MNIQAAAELTGDATLDGPVRMAASNRSASELVDQVSRGEVAAACVPAAHAWTPTGRSLSLAAVLPRQEPRDALLPARPGALTLLTLPPGAAVAVTGSYRAELLGVHRPDLVALDYSNGRTPLSALNDGEVDAAILGAAQARRDGLAERLTEILDPKAWVPPPGQGGAVIFARPDDRETSLALAPLDDFRSRVVLEAERALGDILGVGQGGPLGTLGLPYGRWLRLWAMIPTATDRRLVRCDVSGSDTDPVDVARAAAGLLLKRGAAELLT